ncbi:hypothetical protein AMS58_03750 [Pseudoalteromonas porphyrae]|uniref:hypothetical protein n=1 Tax=Pseudoalteromonas TaxID=53246 RepID=UPI0006BAD77F|nr:MULTISPECIES: hypothetical protein [Pseudoalteromonas]KPH95804.1 hypothetical protein AMS58_03750 [Pseudoalteromonas porphyrae]
MPVNTIDYLTVINSYTPSLTSTNIIALMALLVAFTQCRIQKSNLKLALFEKRFKVYLDSQRLYQEYTKGYISDVTFSNFICSFHASKVLFPKPSGVYAFLDEIHKSAVSFNSTKTASEDTDEPTALEMIDKYRMEACSNLNGFLEELNKLMTPYIKIK